MSVEVQHSSETVTCECAACLGLTQNGGSATVDASLDPQAGGTASGKPILTVEQVAAYLNRTGGGFADGFNDTRNVGVQNNIGDGNDVITFGFFNTQGELSNNGYVYSSGGRLFGLSEYFNFAPMTAAQRDATREIMQSWDDVAAVTFKEVSANDADMNFGNLANAPTTQAYARIPTASLDALIGGQVREIGGDSWISASQASNFQLDEGGYGLQTLLHEAGHALGLSHPGAYNAAPGLSITYAANAEYAQDTRAYSVMSYFNASSLGGRHFDFNISTLVYSGVPLVHDIAAIQRIYGADMTTRTGDTTYGFNSNAGRDSYDFTKTPAPVMAIWDAGGVDTIDASGYATDQIIDLSPGSLSSIGGVTFDTAPSFEQVNINRAAAGFGPLARATYDANMAALKANPAVGRLTDNVGIAYGATIENAVGGTGNDTLLGNSVDNVLTGNAGNDMIGAGAGNDTLNGGAGNDTMLGGIGNDTFIVGEAGDIVTELAGEGTDTVVSSINYVLGANLENLDLIGSAVSGTGNTLDNRISGNDLTNVLAGGGGNDVFVAEINTQLVSTKNGDLSYDVILDFDAGDKIDLSGIDADTTKEGMQDFTFVGSASGKNIGDLSVRTFGNINAAEKALGFDIDGLDTSTHNGKVTVIFGNNDADSEADFAFVVYGDTPIDVSNFIV